MVLAAGENRHFESSENRHFQFNKKSHFQNASNPLNWVVTKQLR